MAEKALRLDKYLADMKAGSRNDVKILIRKSHVHVNGELIRDVGYKVSEKDEITLDGVPISYTEHEYILLNKPAGVVTATMDKHQSTVLDLLVDAKRRDLFPVGRLDKDTEGLLLITNDGKLSHELLSPKKHVDKVYFAKILGRITEKEVQAFADGLKVDEKFTAMPAKLKILCSDEISEIELTIREGKFHQVKRMFEAVGMQVLYLKRISMGSLTLDLNLQPGEYRNLTEQELCALKSGEKEEDEPLLENMLADTEAVIFDLDGTLVDSMWMWRAIDIEYLGRFGLELPENLQAEIEGMSFSETADYFKNHFPEITDSIEEMKQQWNRMAWNKYVNEVPLKPGALEFLRLLKKRGIRTGIATSNSKELVDAVIHSLGIEEYLDEIHTACEVTAGKPAPDIYLLVAECLQVKPEHCLVFEDICKGIESGKRAGMKVCAIQDEYSLADEERKISMADYSIDTYRDFGLTDI